MVRKGLNGILALSLREFLFHLPLGGAKATDALLLAFAEPGLAALAKISAHDEVDEAADDDHDEGDGIEIVDRVAKDSGADDDAPEGAGEAGDIEEGGGAETEQDGAEDVEEGEEEGVAGKVAADFAGPLGVAQAVAGEDGRLHAVDEGGPEGELAEDFVHGPFADEEFLDDVREAVHDGGEQHEEVALDGVGRRGGVGAGDVVGADEHPHAADAEQDTRDLRPVVPDAEHGEGDDHDDDDGAEVDELRGKDVCVLVAEHDEEVALDVGKGKDEVCI